MPYNVQPLPDYKCLIHIDVYLDSKYSCTSTKVLILSLLLLNLLRHKINILGYLIILIFLSSYSFVLSLNHLLSPVNSLLNMNLNNHK